MLDKNKIYKTYIRTGYDPHKVDKFLDDECGKYYIDESKTTSSDRCLPIYLRIMYNDKWIVEMHKHLSETNLDIDNYYRDEKLRRLL
jgi:hypothetical protein